MKASEENGDFERELSEYYVILCDKYTKEKLHRGQGKEVIEYIKAKNGKLGHKTRSLE